MQHVRRHSIWLHFCLPGQRFNDDLLPMDYQFPTLDQISEDVATVLDALDVKTVVAMGEGAGANILCRFGLRYPNRLLGLVLIDCCAGGPGLDDHLLYTAYRWSEEGSKIVDKMLELLGQHKRDQDKSMLANAKPADSRIPPENVAKYLETYLKRTDLLKQLSRLLKVETLLICGARSPQLEAAYAMNRRNPRTTTLTVANGIVDVLFEGHYELARALILFFKGCGVLLNVPLIGLEHEFAAIEQQGTTSTASKTQSEMARALLRAEMQCALYHE